MKRKIIMYIFLVLFIPFILIGCDKNNEVHDDLFSYINDQLPRVIVLENEALDHYLSIVGENYTSDDESFSVLKKLVIPKYTEFVTELEKITPKTDEVKEVHAIYVDAAKQHLSSFEMFKVALEKKDADMVDKANKSLSDARKKIDTFKDALYKLASKNNIELKK